MSGAVFLFLAALPLLLASFVELIWEMFSLAKYRRRLRERKRKIDAALSDMADGLAAHSDALHALSLHLQRYVR